jgi:4-hydroxybenzoate polyprenyltransferase
VDLDGTLLRTDSLVECFVAFLRQRPWDLWRVPGWLAEGKAAFKRHLAGKASVDVDLLPVCDELVDWLRGEAAAGRKLILATGADESIGRRVAARFGFFQDVLASDGRTNLTGSRKARLLVERYGARGFDYAGNSTTDLAVWREAHSRVVVTDSTSLQRRVRALDGGEVRAFAGGGGGLKALIRGLRVHQWAKNILLLVPVLAGHKLGDPAVLMKAVLGVIAFSLCASSVYVANDLCDVESDRRHRTKRTRPLASGAWPLWLGLILAPLLALMGLACGWIVGPAFLGVLGLYLGASSAYTWGLKRLLLIDVFLLAGLYSVRIVAGHVATGIPYSSWLMALSLFLFLSLALMKRYIELARLEASGPQQAAGRDYRASDAPGVFALGAASGYLAVLVLALYVNGEEVRLLYHRPILLLLICPLLLYWVSRIWLLAARREVDDDPVAFALKDRASYIVGALALAVVWLAKVW